MRVRQQKARHEREYRIPRFHVTDSCYITVGTLLFIVCDVGEVTPPVRLASFLWVEHVS